MDKAFLSSFPAVPDDTVQEAVKAAGGPDVFGGGAGGATAVYCK